MTTKEHYFPKGIAAGKAFCNQQTKNISFVFSGSKRHMLAKMFFDKSRPLYKLCSKIMLEKITPQHYKRHLDKFAVKQWGNEIADAVLEKIFELTECHSYYVNSLCDRLWSQSKVPTIKLVEAQWLKILHEEKLEIAAELQVLSPGQRKILIAIADGNNTELTSKQFLQIVDLSSSSVSQAVSLLVSKDYIELNEHGVYKFIDPMLKASLRYFYLR